MLAFIVIALRANVLIALVVACFVGVGAASRWSLNLAATLRLLPLCLHRLQRRNHVQEAKSAARGAR